MCDNLLTHYDGSPCAFEKYYGHCSLDPRAFLTYGAQGHYLIDPEKRTAKFDDHAAAGVYRGPSRVNLSGTACLMWNGTKHVTVDVADIKLCENGVIAKCNNAAATGNVFAVGRDEIGEVTTPSGNAPAEVVISGDAALPPMPLPLPTSEAVPTSCAQTEPQPG